MPDTRPTADSITDAALAALVADRDRLQSLLARIRSAPRAADAWAAIGMHDGMTPDQAGVAARRWRSAAEAEARSRADQAEAKRDRYRAAWLSARGRAAKRARGMDRLWTVAIGLARRAAAAGAALPTGDPGLRDRVRRAICEASGFAWDDEGLEPDEYGDQADAVLAVLPADADRGGWGALVEETGRLRKAWADMGRRAAELEAKAVGLRAAVLREAADALSMDWGGPDHADGMGEARAQLRRMADEVDR